MKMWYLFILNISFQCLIFNMLTEQNTGDSVKSCVYPICCKIGLQTEAEFTDVIPGLAVGVDLVSCRRGVECGIELCVLVVLLQVEGLQRIHGPIKQRVVQQHLHTKKQKQLSFTDKWHPSRMRCDELIHVYLNNGQQGFLRTPHNFHCFLTTSKNIIIRILQFLSQKPKYL